MIGNIHSRSFTMAGTEWSSKRVLVIAEAGTAHQASLERARLLVDAAVDSGADCIKFQHVYADEILHPNTGTVPLPGGDIRLYDQFKALERDAAFLTAIKDYCAEQGILFLCTPFGQKSCDELLSMGVQGLKVASPELNHLPLLARCAAAAVPLILSSGVSRLSDIELAVETVRSKKDPLELALLHCITSYPAPEREYNLELLPLLGTLFDLPMGVSDHSMDCELVPTLAVAKGACIIEKHLCLSRADAGLDDPIALEPLDFTRMVKFIREASRTEAAELIERLSRERGAELVAAILGNGRKTLAPSERANYYRTRRSVHALEDLPAGHRLSHKDMAILRTEKVLRPGLDPVWFDALAGHTLAKPVPAGEGIRLEDLE